MVKGRSRPVLSAPEPEAKVQFVRLIHRESALANRVVEVGDRRAVHRRHVPAFSFLWIVVLGLLLLAASSSWAEEIVLLRGSQAHAAEYETIRKLADFYGLELKEIDAASRDALTRVKTSDAVAVIASPDALSELGNNRIQSTLEKPKRKSIPLLVFGISPEDDAHALTSISDGAVQKCATLPSSVDSMPKAVAVENVSAMTGVLAGVELPVAAFPRCELQVAATQRTQVIVSGVTNGHKRPPILLRAQAHNAEVFLVPEMQSFGMLQVSSPRDLPRAFSTMAPFIFFMSYAAKDYGWHLDGHYANFTVDDAWLTQPYGNLDYRAILAEMEKHRFHTTVAFIPWNYDRSRPDVVQLFRTYPNRFSVCVHGNNHDHREFGDYALHSLSDQVNNLKQAVARMERFRQLTGIPYDKFMVFPHGVSPRQTFGAIKEYQFLGTANAIDVPSDMSMLNDPVFLLRPYTTSYENLLSFTRYSAEGDIPRLEIAIHAFMGTPLLFYGHEKMFHKNIGAFNPFADLVNQLQPDTQWTSLGEIARHSHLIRKVGDDFEVLMFSPEMELRNPTVSDRVFHIRMRDVGVSISGVAVDGAGTAFERSNQMLAFDVRIPAHQSRKVSLVYPNDLGVASADISRHKFYVNALRHISDFRDLYLSRSSWGYFVISGYYGKGWDSIERNLERKWWVGAMFVIITFAAFVHHRRTKRQPEEKQAASSRSA